MADTMSVISRGSQVGGEESLDNQPVDRAVHEGVLRFLPFTPASLNCEIDKKTLTAWMEFVDRSHLSSHVVSIFSPSRTHHMRKAGKD